MKKCILCKKDSSKSCSVEHIVPESLGNKLHTLPKKVVCDRCNNYFALKIEKVVLEQNFFKNLRHRNRIISKKGRIPDGKIIVPNFLKEFTVKSSKRSPTVVDLDKEAFEAILNGDIDYLIVPMDTKPLEKNRDLSRFLGKMALEAFFYKIKDAEGAHSFIINNTDFDSIRDYVRYNKSRETWNYHVRKIYNEEEKFYFGGNALNPEVVDMLFEFDFLITNRSEGYFTIVIKGYEFTINIGGESIEGYLEWLAENDNLCHLYRDEKLSIHVPIAVNFLKA